MEPKALNLAVASYGEQIPGLQSLRTSIGDVLIGTVLRDDYRSTEFLLSAFALLNQRHRDARLIIIGDSPARASLEKRSSDLKLAEYVIFVGMQDDTAAWVSNIDIFALPLESEAFPEALQEAMAAGKAVVTSATPRLRKLIIDGKTGRLSEPGDLEGFARILEEIAENRAMRLSLGSHAQQFAKDMYGGSLFAGRASYGYMNEPPVPFIRRIVKRLITSSVPKKRLLWHGRRDLPQFALTFDDGPDPLFTPLILDILRTHQARATFFLVGNRAEEYPDIVRRIGDEGHELGNHSYSHARLQKLTFNDATAEVADTARILEQLHARSRFFRPPFGSLSPQSMAAAWKARHAIAMFSVDLKDYRAKSPSEIVARLDEGEIVNGDIILYHGTNHHSLAALPRVIERARQNGRNGVLISEINT